MASETVKEFKARGGKVVKLPAGGRRALGFMKVKSNSIAPGIKRARAKHIKLARVIDARAA